MSDFQTRRSPEKRVRGARFKLIAPTVLIAMLLLTATACNRTAPTDTRHEVPIQTVSTSADSQVAAGCSSSARRRSTSQA